MVLLFNILFEDHWDLGIYIIELAMHFTKAIELLHILLTQYQGAL